MVTTYPWIRKRPGWETDLTNQQLAMQPSKVAWPLTDLLCGPDKLEGLSLALNNRYKL